jgi:hypothetical protein
MPDRRLRRDPKLRARRCGNLQRRAALIIVPASSRRVCRGTRRTARERCASYRRHILRLPTGGRNDDRGPPCQRAVCVALTFAWDLIGKCKMTTSKKWRMSKDPLYRGDAKDSVCVPNPRADDSIVRHVMYFEGPGRESPYLSTSEEYELADNFANGAVWETFVSAAKKESVQHISRAELLSLMKGNGKGKAKWPSAYEVMQARRYVEQWGEHLLDFREVDNPGDAVKKIFSKS